MQVQREWNTTDAIIVEDVHEPVSLIFRPEKKGA